jgi:hypothetical protein
MLRTIQDLPYWEVHFDADGRVTDDSAFLDETGAGGTGDELTDLVVIAHGWNNTEHGARSMYERIAGLLSEQLTAQQRPRTGVIGVFWPSLLFPEDGPPDPGVPAVTRSTGEQLAAAITPAFPGRSAQVAELGTLLDSRPQDPQALDRFHELATGLVTTPPVGGPEDNGERTLLQADARTAIGAMTGDGPRSDVQGGNPFESLWNRARDLLRTLSYYEMKSRAGVVGEIGLGPFLASVRQQAPQLRVHLVGHSFGARLVAFALKGLPGDGASGPVKSLSLLQGAFSHFTFSPAKPGALKDMLTRVDGPLIATHSVHDRAVGTWYPAASRLARQNDQADEDFNFEWGGLGHDGFQQPDVQQLSLGPPGTHYGFQTGHLYRLDGSDVIKENQSWFSEAHSDILHPEVTWAIASAADLVS